MRSYNKALDCLALATAQLLKGRPVTAGQLLVKASKMPDVVEAINIIEASNKEAHSRMVMASQQAKKKQQAAKRPVKAAEDMEEDDAIKGLVGDNEELDDDEGMEVESRAKGAWSDMGEEEPGEALDEAIVHEDAEITAKLAQVLSTMTKRTAAKQRR